MFVAPAGRKRPFLFACSVLCRLLSPARDRDHVLPSLFRRNERAVSRFKQLVRALGRPKHPDTDAYRHDRLVTMEALLNRRANTLGDLVRHCHRRGRHHDHELLASVAGAHIETANAGAQKVRHLSQRAISFEVAAGVIDPLEIVNVDQQDSKIQLLSAERSISDLQPRFEIAPVEQARDRVDGGKFGDLGEARAETFGANAGAAAEASRRADLKSRASNMPPSLRSVSAITPSRFSPANRGNNM